MVYKNNNIFLQKIEQYFTPKAQTGETKSSVAAAELEEVPEIKGRKVTGVGFGPNILGKGEIVLKPTNRGFPPTTVAIATASKNVHASEPITSVAVSVDFEALLNYFF